MDRTNKLQLKVMFNT